MEEIITFSNSSSSDLNNVSIDPKETPDFLFGSLKPEDLVRGETPADIETRCLDLCQTYIGGGWNLVQSSNDFIVKRITGGLTNQLYRIQLKPSFADINAAICADVAIKFYQSKHIENFDKSDHERLNDTIINTILSQIGIGPKVFGIFDGGMIQQFYENEEFSSKHQKNPVLLKKLITSLATVHHLNVPIRKDPNSWYNEIEKNFNTAYDKLNAQVLIDSLKLENLKIHDPRVEFQKLLRLIADLKAPIVFCHNDFRGSNILVTKPEQNIILTDAEYSAYGQRAHDIGNYIVEWDREIFDFENHELPSDEVLSYFIGIYVEACNQLVPGFSQKSENSVEAIAKEVKIMAMAKYLFMLAFFMRSTESLIASVPFDVKENMKYSEFVYSKYFKIKQRLIDEKVIVDY